MKRTIAILLARWALVAGAAWAQGEAPIALSLPGLSWALEIAAPGFVVEESELAPGGAAARLQAVNKETDVILSAFLEKAAGPGGARECRAYYWARAQKSPVPKEQVRLHESGDLALVEYLVPEYLGMRLNQKNVNAYLAEDGYWMDVHFSKTDFDSAPEDPISPVLGNIRIRRAYAPTASACFQFGNYFFRRKAYVEAAGQYEKALESENQQRTLDRAEWLVLVDQLGMARGISGDLAGARDLYEWALAKEPEYPVFHYNLACALAESGEASKALASLGAAFRHKAGMLPGEVLPDPRKDPSFAKLLRDPAFRAAVEQIPMQK